MPAPRPARETASTPAATYWSPSPALTAWKAIRSVWSEEAQKRLTVVAGAGGWVAAGGGAVGGDVGVDPREELGVAADGVALLALLEPAAHHDVLRLGEVDLRVAVDERLERHGGQVVRTDVLERPLDRAPDRGANGIDDDGFRHGFSR